MGSWRGKGSFGGGVRDCMRKMSHPWGSTLQTNTIMQRGVESDSKIGEGHADLQFVLDRFQESLTKATDTEHVEGATIKYRQRDRVATLKQTHRRPAVELELALKIMSGYDRVFRSFEIDGIFVKLWKMSGGGVGLS